MLKILWTSHNGHADDYVYIHDIIEDELGHRYLFAETIDDHFNLTGEKKVYVVHKEYAYKDTIEKDDFYALYIDKCRIAYADDYEESLQLIHDIHGYGPYGA